MTATTSTTPASSSVSRPAARSVSLLMLGKDEKPEIVKPVEISVLDRVNPNHPACKESIETVVAVGEVKGNKYSWTDKISLTLATGQGRGPLVLAIEDIAPSIGALEAINVEHLRAEMQGKEIVRTAAENILHSAKMIMVEGQEFITFTPGSGRGNKIQRIPASQFAAFVAGFKALMTSYLPTLEKMKSDESHAYNVALLEVEMADKAAAAAAAAVTETSVETQVEAQVETSVETQVEAQVEAQVETSVETQVEASAVTSVETSVETSESLSDLATIPSAPSEKKSRNKKN
jgi:hypothetical protein